ncbi:MAG: cobalt ECF transporter T component CbiQ [Candidatus Bathyarchaeota archaeon]|nr:cobalt ECF transporter T component CbiQ [Candidatus Bathyarchaeota archaeon]
MSHHDISAEIDHQAYINAIAKNSPITKIFFALSSLVISVSAPTPIVPIVIFIINAILLLSVAKVPAKFYLHLLEYPTLAVTLSVLIIALFFGFGQTITQITLPWFTWSIYQNGITMAVATFFRVEGAISSTFFLVLTTPMTGIFVTLRRIKTPKVLIEMSLLIYRYIFVFMEVSATMNTAQNLRLGYSSMIRRIRSAALLAGNLFIRTLEQGERTFTAMSARGYDGNIRLLEDLPRPRKSAIAAIILFDAVFVIAIFLLIYFGVV